MSMVLRVLQRPYFYCSRNLLIVQGELYVVFQNMRDCSLTFFVFLATFCLILSLHLLTLEWLLCTSSSLSMAGLDYLSS